MEETLNEQREFSRISGEILSMALGVESHLEFFISNYFIRPQNDKTFFFNDTFMIKSTFERKVQTFKDICKREKFDEAKINETLKSINFVKEARNKVAHWQGEKMFDKPLRLRKRTSRTKKEDILELNEDFLKEVDSERLKALQGIDELYLKYYREGTIDDKPVNFENREVI